MKLQNFLFIKNNSWDVKSKTYETPGRCGMSRWIKPPQIFPLL